MVKGAHARAKNHSPRQKRRWFLFSKCGLPPFQPADPFAPITTQSPGGRRIQNRYSLRKEIRSQKNLKVHVSRADDNDGGTLGGQSCRPADSSSKRWGAGLIPSPPVGSNPNHLGGQWELVSRGSFLFQTAVPPIFPLQPSLNSENMKKNRGESFWRNFQLPGNNVQAMIQLVPADIPEKIEKAREIFRLYARSLDFDLSFQGFAAELAGLPGDYAPPAGRLFLALDKDETAGCVALRKIGDGVCEMKRLFVAPGQRGRGIGRALAAAIIREAKNLGYKRMRLDTVPSMVSAIGLYRSLGFEEIPPYCYNPVPGTKFFELRLGQERSVDEPA